jgi:DNA-binding MarR family transcriptional regulator
MQDGIADELELLLGEVVALAGSLQSSARQEFKALSLTSHAVLRLLLEHRALTVPQLARLRGVSRQSMQVLVDRLANDKCVEYAANPDHQRSELLTLTASGARRLEVADQQQAVWLASLLPQVSERALRTSIRQLRQIHSLLRARSSLPPVMQKAASALEATSPVPRRRRPRRVRPHSHQTRSGTIAVAEPPAAEAALQEIGMEELPVTLL